jgi:DNA-binding NarL/FixJ family response regulator
LSPAERDVALLVCHGLSDKEIADRLCRSYHTIRVEKKSIYKKLGVSKETELLWYMIFEKQKREFDLSLIREKGLGAL